MRAWYAQYISPTQLNCRVASRRRRRCEQNSQLAHDDCDGFGQQFETDQTDSIRFEYVNFCIDINNFFNNDIIISSIVTNLNSSTAQEIVNWVTTAYGCVYTADATQLDS